MSYYTFSSKDIDKKLNEIQYGADAAALIEKLESEMAELRAMLETAEKPLQQAALENVQENANRQCTNDGAQTSTFILGWRAAEAFHNIGTPVEKDE